MLPGVAQEPLQDAHSQLPIGVVPDELLPGNRIPVDFTEPFQVPRRPTAPKRIGRPRKLLPEEAYVSALPPGIHEDARPMWDRMPTFKRFQAWTEIVDCLNDIRRQRQEIIQKASTTVPSSEPIQEPPDAGGGRQ